MSLKKSILVLFSVFIIILMMTGTASARPLADAIGTGFTYQGRLMDGGSPANGSYDFQFNLFNALSGGAQVGPTLTQTGVTVSNGLFTVQLDFGNVYDGTALYLQVAVSPNGANTYTPLTPLQPLSATPYALYSKQAGNAALLGGNLAGNASGNVPLSNGNLNTNLNADLLDGQHAGNASGNVPLSNGVLNNNLNADKLDGQHAGNANGNVSLSNGTVNTNLNSDLLDGQHAGNASGNVPLSNGTLNTNLNADLLDGLNASAFAQTPQNVVIVAKSGGNFTTITAALNSIADASDTNRYLVYVAPGVYTEQVTMKQYVDIQGSGELTTKITSTGVDSFFNGTLLGANNAELRFLTVENTGGSNKNAVAIYNNSASPRLTHVTVIADGLGSSYAWGISNTGSSSPNLMNVNINAFGAPSANNYGIVTQDSSVVNIQDSVITASAFTLYIDGTIARVFASQLNGGKILPTAP